jgi:hypothetical protein
MLLHLRRWQQMAKKFPLHPKHPERICWGCDKYCSVDDLRCGNGSGRTQHPAELLGDDWYEHGDWGIDGLGDTQNDKNQ